MIWYIAAGSAAGGVARSLLGTMLQLGGGLVTLERARVIVYRPGEPPDE